MNFLEVVGATALGATVPVVVTRYLDRRVRRREGELLRQTGLGRYVEQTLVQLDTVAAELSERTSRNDERATDEVTE